MSEEYRAWADVPAHLKTKTQLGQEGLKPAPGQEIVAQFCSFIRGRRRPTYYKLYDLNQAIPKRQPSEAQCSALAAARERSLWLRTCIGGCGTVLTPQQYRDYPIAEKREGRFYCQFCRDRAQATDWARGVLADPNAIILDTETTGLEINDQVIEIAIISTNGQVLLDTLVKHCLPGIIPPEVTRIHGITDETLEDAPPFAGIYSELRCLLRGASRIIVYNAAFDHRLLNQTRRAWRQPLFKPAPFECAMDMYAQWYGEWSYRYESYRWQPLGGATHRALDDCRAVLNRLERMAHTNGSPVSSTSPKGEPAKKS